jgi:hypothetical protein
MHPMTILRAALFLGLLVGNATAQVAKVLELNDVAAALEARSGQPEGSVSSLGRLARLLRTHWQEEAQTAAKGAPVRRRRATLQLEEKSNTMLVSALQQQADLAEDIVDLLRQGPTRELRVHCTLVHLPMQVATEHGLVAGQVSPIDEPTAGKLIKTAVQAKGRLQNLPEQTVLPLRPFRAEPPAEPGKAAAAPTTLRVHGEAVLVSDQEALFGVQLVAGDLPEDPTLVPLVTRFAKTFRLQVGTGIVVLAPAAKDAPEDAPAVALWLQLVSVTAAPPAKKPADADAGK